MEIDIMSRISNMQTEKELLCKIFNELTLGGAIQKSNFKTSLEKGEYVSCLNKIESSNSGIGKGRFAQHLSVECTKTLYLAIYKLLLKQFSKEWTKFDGIIQ